MLFDGHPGTLCTREPAQVVGEPTSAVASRYASLGPFPAAAVRLNECKDQVVGNLVSILGFHPASDLSIFLVCAIFTFAVVTILWVIGLFQGNHSMMDGWYGPHPRCWPT